VIDLERLGYLERSPDPQDRRAKLIGFTEKGRSAVQAALHAFDHMDDRLAASLGSTTARTLRRALMTAIATSLSPADTSSGRTDPTGSGTRTDTA
jgi:DNA-binding MarR family transcriptional regulator